MRKPRSVLIVYEPISSRWKKGYKLLQVTVKTNDRENILLFSNEKISSIANTYFDSMYSIHIAVIELLKNNNFIPHYLYEFDRKLFDLDFLNISNPTELKRYWF